MIVHMSNKRLIECSAHLPALRGILCIVSLLICAVARAQHRYEVPEPLAPTSMAECDAFQRSLEQRAKELNAHAIAIHDQLYHSCADLKDNGAAVQCWNRLHADTYQENTNCGSILYGFPQQERSLRYQAACASMRARTLPAACRLKVSARVQSQSQERQSAIGDSSPVPGRDTPIALAQPEGHQGVGTSSSTTGPDEQTDSHADATLEQAFDEAKDLFERAIKDDEEQIERNLAVAKSKMSSATFSRYQQQAQQQVATLGVIANMVKAHTYTQDVAQCLSDPSNGCHDLIGDGVKDGFDATLEKFAPQLAKFLDAPLAAATILLNSTSTQTPDQDLNPLIVIRNPEGYTYQQRSDALQWCFQDAARHPENWSSAKLQWLSNQAAQIYNSVDNPDIHLTPQ